MRIEVEKNGNVTTHEADLLTPISREDSIMIYIKGDLRPIGMIANDFEKPDDIRTDDGTSYAEYKEPIVVYRMDPETVQLRIRKPTL